jgi:hypothetical protein
VTRFPEATDCSWCGLYRATTIVSGTPTCPGCAKGGKRERVMQSLKRWARGKEKKGKGAA